MAAKNMHSTSNTSFLPLLDSNVAQVSNSHSCNYCGIIDGRTRHKCSSETHQSVVSLQKQTEYRNPFKFPISYILSRNFEDNTGSVIHKFKCLVLVEILYIPANNVNICLRWSYFKNKESIDNIIRCNLTTAQRINKTNEPREGP